VLVESYASPNAAKGVTSPTPIPLDEIAQVRKEQ